MSHDYMFSFYSYFGPHTLKNVFLTIMENYPKIRNEFTGRDNFKRVGMINQETTQNRIKQRRIEFTSLYGETPCYPFKYLQQIFSLSIIILGLEKGRVGFLAINLLFLIVLMFQRPLYIQNRPPISKSIFGISRNRYSQMCQIKTVINC